MDATDDTLSATDEIRYGAALELVSEDGDEWTALPPDTDGDCASRWITGERESLRDLEEWR